MAKPQENPSANKQNNSSARRQVILDVCADLASLEARRGEITEEISSLKSQRIKGDLGMKISDFNAAYRLYRLEDADRDIFLDTLRETFEALGVGGQLDFIKAGAADAPVGPAAAAGEKAGKAGKPFDSNPYPKDTPANKSWAEAWEAAQANNLKDLGTGAPAH
jgi:hypothetical protein